MMFPDRLLVPVKWAEAQIPIFQGRLEAWHHRDPYILGIEPDPDRPNWEYVVAYDNFPIDPEIVGDVGAIINSTRTGLSLLVAAVAASHNGGVIPKRTPDFPFSRLESEFLNRINRLKDKHGFSDAEIARIKATNAYLDGDAGGGGGDAVFYWGCELDNIRKHRRLIRAAAFGAEITFTGGAGAGIGILRKVDDKTILYTRPGGRARPTKGNTNFPSEVFLNEVSAGIGNVPALPVLRWFIERVRKLVETFP
jgi:hypothetical protein